VKILGAGLSADGDILIEDLDSKIGEYFQAGAEPYLYWEFTFALVDDEGSQDEMTDSEDEWERDINGWYQKSEEEERDVGEEEDLFGEEETAINNDPDTAQPECLAPARLDQPGATAQACGGTDAIQAADSNIKQGKSDGCTADVDLRQELDTLRKATPNAFEAIITFERHSVQMFFSPDNAMADFQRKVKELWNIPVKQYYLLLNGMHESKIPKDWSKVKAVQVRIKGLVGGYDPPADGGEDFKDTPVPESGKFPKGWIKLGIAGIMIKVHTSFTIDQARTKFDLDPAYEYWLPNGRIVSCREKLRRLFPPGLKQIHFIDEVVPGEAREELRELGPVMLKIGGSTITVLNNQTFEEAFKKNEIIPESEFVLLPDGRRANVSDARIRQFLGSNIDDEFEIRWERKDSPTLAPTKTTPGLEDGWADYPVKKKDDSTESSPRVDPHKKEDQSAQADYPEQSILAAESPPKEPPPLLEWGDEASEPSKHPQAPAEMELDSGTIDYATAAKE
jgi:hypothetical protein